MEILEPFLEELRLVRRLSPRTVEAYRSDLGAYSGFLEQHAGKDPLHATAQDLVQFLDSLRRSGRAASSVARMRSTLRAFHRYLCREGYREDDPTSELRGLKVLRPLPRILDREEIDRLLGACDGDGSLELRNRALVEIGYGAGLRVSELVGLQKGSLVSAEDGLWVRVWGKGSRERMVPLGHPAETALRRYLAEGRGALCGAGGRDPDALFLNARGRPLGRTGFWRILKDLAKNAMLDSSQVHPHVLRHSCATHLLEGGASLRVVQEFLGHAQISTTEIYTALDKSRLRDVYRQAHPRAAVVGGGS